jgi:hypothetical protein
MNVGGAIEGLFYAFLTAVGSAIILAFYVFWQAVLSSTPWEVCVKMETDQAKVQCMEAHYE